MSSDQNQQSALKQLEKHKCFDGYVYRFSHRSAVLNCDMNFHVFVPPSATPQNKAPCLYFLSGLTCTDVNFITKSGVFASAAKHGIALICPDTSPRGAGVETEEDAGQWDVGCGAGFYVNATTDFYSRHFRMYDYVTAELPQLLLSAAANTSESTPSLPLDVARCSVFGHSMGGHGALVCALRSHSERSSSSSGLNGYRSVSAFSPICHPTSADCAWGQKAFRRYLGDDESLWRRYDATCLMKEYSGSIPILIDQGDADEFLGKKQLQPEAFEAACRERSYAHATVRMQPGYDHSYYFISTFIDDHIAFHAKHLSQ